MSLMFNQPDVEWNAALTASKAYNSTQEIWLDQEKKPTKNNTHTKISLSVITDADTYCKHKHPASISFQTLTDSFVELKLTEFSYIEIHSWNLVK